MKLLDGWVPPKRLLGLEVTVFQLEIHSDSWQTICFPSFSFQLETWNWHFPFPLKLSWLSVSAKAFPIFCSSSNASYVFPPAGHAQRCSRQGAFCENNIRVGQSSNDETPPIQYLLGSLFSKHSKPNDFLGSWNRCFFNCICICVSCFCVFVCFCCPISETPLNNTIPGWGPPLRGGQE